MRKLNRFLSLAIAFLFSCVFIHQSQAQEILPQIVKKIEPATVVIFTYDNEGVVIGQGSGFFISEKGDIITNRHVLEGASRAEVKTAKGKVYPITRIVAEDNEGDLIRVFVDIPSNIVVHHLSVSTSLPEVGERVVVIGSPLGLEQTVSDGIVSAVRDIPEFGSIIQITTPISHDFSGSPVVNMKGEVIGVATFVMVDGQNLNFAIPGERVARLKPVKWQTFSKWQEGRAEEKIAPAVEEEAVVTPEERLDSASAEGLYSTGLTLICAEKYEEAITYFEKAVKKDPNYTEAYFQIGYCNDSLGRYNEAIEAYKQAIRVLVHWES